MIFIVYARNKFANNAFSFDIADKEASPYFSLSNLQVVVAILGSSITAPFAANPVWGLML